MLARGALLLCLLWLALVCLADDDSVPSLMAEMSLRSKVSQLFMVSFYGKSLSWDEAAFLREIKPGAAVLFRKNIESPAQVTRLINDWQREATADGGLPMLIAVDQEGGRVQHLRSGFTALPSPLVLTAAADADLATRVGAAVAAELRAVGVNMNLAPVADLLTNRDNPVIRRRSFGGAPAQVNPIIAAYIRGLQGGGVAATAKHFPGHGSTAEDSHLELPELAADLDTLRSLELSPFRAAIDAGVDVIMVGHLWLSAVDAEPLPASLSRAVVAGLLRGELGFEGLIMTDALDMDAIDKVYGYAEASILALGAGVDLIAIGAHVGTRTIRRAIDAVVAAVADGRLSQERIDESVTRVLTLKRRRGLLGWTPADPATVAMRLNLAAHGELVAQLMQRGLTAWDPQGRLPLTGETLIIYPGGRPRIAEACDAPGVRFLAVSQSPTESEIALAAAGRAENIVVFTLDPGNNRQLDKLISALPRESLILAALWEPPRYSELSHYGAALMSYDPIWPAERVACQALLGEREATGVYPLRDAA